MPVQCRRIASLQFAIWVELIPALAAFFLRSRIPCNAERLNPAARKLNEVLLERPDAERVTDLKIAERSIWTVGSDPKLAVLFVECACDFAVAERTTVEPAKHSLLGGRLHGDRVLGAKPVFVLGCVTLSALV